MFFCDSTSKFLTSSFRVSHSRVGGWRCVFGCGGGGGGGEERPCPPMYVQFCHSAIRWGTYTYIYDLYINIHFPSTLIS